MKNKKPYYSKKTKQKVVFDYEKGLESAVELSRLYGIFGSNTVANWVKKYGKLDAKNIMRKSTLPKDSGQRQRRQRTYEQVRISELEIELQEARLRVRLYSCALQVASDATGIDLVKKTGELLSDVRTKKKS